MAYSVISWIVVIVFSSLVLLKFVAEGATQFSLLEKTLLVSASLNDQSGPISVARAGIDKLHVSWSLNSSTSPGVDASYKSVNLELCFAPVSQVDRPWRKTYDLLAKDKTCTFGIATQPYTAAAGNSTVWTVGKQVPEATYFVRAYAMDATKEKVAFGQTTNENKTTNLFVVDPITGRHASIDIAAGIFSAFSVFALFGFFIVERTMLKKNRS